MHDTVSLRQVCLQDPFIRPKFLDVYGADQVPRIPDTYPCCCIANTDPIHRPGRHWVAVYWIGPDKGEFFNSYAERPSWLNERWRCFDGFRQIPHELQAYETDVCGDYCLYFLYRRCRDVPMSSIVKPFSKSDLAYNDQAVLERMHDLFPERLNSQLHPEVSCQYCILRNRNYYY